ncbi:MAG TPA: ABC transporter permease [Firmicutes bacterium]|nr:ABC transporter permease [Bacillota bacterium]
MHPLKHGEINGAIAIPRGFTESIAKGEQTAVTAITDQSNPQVSAMLSTMLEKVMDGISTKIAEEKAKAVTATTRALTPMTPVVANPQALVKPFIVRQEGIVGGEPNYFQFMAPGIMAMVVVMAVMIGLAGAISRKREIGTLDGILIAPIDRLSIILGKTFSKAVRGFAQGALVPILAMLLFHVRIYGNLLLVVFLLLLGTFSFVGLGILIAAFASQQETAMTILMTLNFPMMFLRGAFFPVQQMPEMMRWISKLIPLTYTIQGLRKIMILGARLSAISVEITVSK